MIKRIFILTCIFFIFSSNAYSETIKDENLFSYTEITNSGSGSSTNSGSGSSTNSGSGSSTNSGSGSSTNSGSGSSTNSGSGSGTNSGSSSNIIKSVNDLILPQFLNLKTGVIAVGSLILILALVFAKAIVIKRMITSKKNKLAQQRASRNTYRAFEKLTRKK